MDDLLKIAEQAGLGEILPERSGVPAAWFGFNQSSIETFAKLIEQRKCQEIAAKCEKLPFGDTAQSFATWIREQ
jgi:hypothetical protein